MIQWIVSSSVLILVVIALRYVLRGKISLRMQYALWLLVLVRLLVPVSFGATDLSVMNAVPERAPTEQQGNYKRDIVGERNDAAPAAPTVGVPAQSMNEPVPPDLVQNITTTTVTAPTAEKTDWAQVGKIVWLVGAAALGLVFLAVNLRFGKQLRRSRQRVADAEASLPVYESGATDTPCLFGVAKPSIYVTPDTRADAPTLRYALAHEQTHYRHGDNLWAVLRGVCLALHWYNPLVWWAAELSRRDAELACDEATIRRLGESERAAYGRTLIRMTCEKRPALLVTATMMTDSGKGLKERISLLVKKPKTAAYTAIAVLLIAGLSIACTFTGGKTELPDPFGKDYEAVEVVYQAPEYDFSLTVDTAPYFRIGADGQSLTVVDLNRNGLPAESLYGALEEYTLTKESFDDRFRAAEDGTSGWADKTGSAASLRRENAKAWHCTAAEDPSWPEEIYLLQQKDGTLYLIMGYDWEASERFPDGLHFFRWLFRLTEKPVPTYASMEEYVLSVIDGLKQPDGYTYYILPDGAQSSVDGTPIEVTEAAADVRVTKLEKLGDCMDLAPDGTLELWSFSYEVKPEDKTGALPDRFFWVGGNNITDDGYISEGFFYYLTVLRTDDDPSIYKLLDSQMTNDGLWYNGCTYTNTYEYLYDFYADYASLDVPRYLVPNFFTGLISDPTILQTSEDGEGHRYDGNGWYLYTPTVRWLRTTNAGEDCWYSGYQTGSTLRVDKSMDSVEMMEAFYREGGFTLEQYQEGAALSGPWTRFDAESGTQFANYLAPDTDYGGCYIISTYWTPTDEIVTNQWGDWNKGAQVQNEAAELRQMAQSFTVSGNVYSYVPTFQSDLDLASNGKAAWLYLVEDGATVGGYSVRGTWNVPALNSYNYVMCDAPKESGRQLALWLSNNDASYFVFYEGTNIVAYYRGMNDPVDYYEAQDDFGIVGNDGRALYDRILMWYDEAEFGSMRDEVEQGVIPDRGQSWEEAAKEYLDAYEGVHLQVRSGSLYKFTWMKNLVRSAADDVAQWSPDFRPQPAENEHYFYSTTEFVPETEWALNMAMAGNTGDCGDSDAPEGAFEYYRCCIITLKEDGWHGEVGGTGW